MEVPDGGVVVPFPATIVMASVYPTSVGFDSEATTIVSTNRQIQNFVSFGTSENTDSLSSA